MENTRPSSFRPTMIALALSVVATACSNDASSAAPVPAVSPASQQVATASQAAAPAAGDPMAQMARMGGGMQALAEACGGYGPAELAEMKAAQRAMSAQSGVSGQAFDAGFDAGFAEGKAKLAAASPADRAQACAEASRLQGG